MKATTEICNPRCAQRRTSLPREVKSAATKSAQQLFEARRLVGLLVAVLDDDRRVERNA